MGPLKAALTLEQPQLIEALVFPLRQHVSFHQCYVQQDPLKWTPERKENSSVFVPTAANKNRLPSSGPLHPQLAFHPTANANWNAFTFRLVVHELKPGPDIVIDPATVIASAVRVVHDEEVDPQVSELAVVLGYDFWCSCSEDAFTGKRWQLVQWLSRLKRATQMKHPNRAQKRAAVMASNSAIHENYTTTKAEEKRALRQRWGCAQSGKISETLHLSLWVSCSMVFRVTFCWPISNRCSVESLMPTFRANWA